MTALLEIHGLVKHHDQRQALKGVDLTVHRGEVLGLVGPNGAGKSTLIGTLAGLVPIERGTIKLDGENFRPDSAQAAQAAGVSLVQQNFTVPPGMSVPRAIYRNTYLAGRSEEELRGMAEELIAEHGLDLDVSRATADLDRSEEALLEVARVIAENAQLVVFDEVVVTLGDDDVARLHEAIRNLRRRGCAVVYIAHRLDEVQALADRIVVLRDGLIVEDIDARDSDLHDLARQMLQREVLASASPAPRDLGGPLFRVEDLETEGAFRGVSFEVREGEVLGVLGLRGSGGQKLAAALGGQSDPAYGAAWIRDRQLDTLQDEREIAYHDVVDDSTLDDVAIASIAAGDAEGSEIAQLRAAADRIHEWGLSTSDIRGSTGTLSGGDRQRLVLGTLLQDTDASVIVLNHPSRGVDLGARYMIHEHIEELAAKGRAIIVFSNDTGELMRLANRILVLRDGEVVGLVDNASTDEDQLMALAGGGELRSTGSRALV